ncbi:hypothetical protein ACQHIH_16160 [Xanthomonas sontii]|uniref:hypothetical protein n=1 Tax=Xanthomonas sontii TaxID=2650745 RepID=UPI003F8493CD
MIWPYWLIGAVVVLLLCLAFRRKRVADEICCFFSPMEAREYVNRQDKAGFDCFISFSNSFCGWEVRCYRRKERQG